MVSIVTKETMFGQFWSHCFGIYFRVDVDLLTCLGPLAQHVGPDGDLVRDAHLPAHSGLGPLGLRLLGLHLLGGGQLLYTQELISVKSE